MAENLNKPLIYRNIATDRNGVKMALGASYPLQKLPEIWFVRLGCRAVGLCADAWPGLGCPCGAAGAAVGGAVFRRCVAMPEWVGPSAAQSCHVVRIWAAHLGRVGGKQGCCFGAGRACRDRRSGAAVGAAAMLDGNRHCGGWPAKRDRAAGESLIWREETSACDRAGRRTRRYAGTAASLSGR